MVVRLPWVYSTDPTSTGYTLDAQGNTILKK
jgi:hypothetical protein